VTFRPRQIVGAILLIGGLLFVFDVLSPVTPTPQAQIRDFLGIVFCLALALTRFDEFRPLPHPALFRSVAPLAVPFRRVTTWICVLLC
jgi:hypothetical protein